MIEYSGNCRFDSSGPASSYVMSIRCNRKPFGRYEGRKQMISSFLKSFNVSSGVERTAESENTNKAWCHAIEAIPNHRNWNTTDSMTMSSIERGARGFVFNVANQSVTLSRWRSLR